jgi:hypothetical protein
MMPFDTMETSESREALELLRKVYESMTSVEDSWCQRSMGTNGVHCVLGWAEHHGGNRGMNVFVDHLAPLISRFRNDEVGSPTPYGRYNRVVRMNDSPGTTKALMIALIEAAIRKLDPAPPEGPAVE